MSSLTAARPEAEELLQRVDDAAIRKTTRCGDDAVMVWRKWGEGRPVVLLHGGSGSWTHWIRTIPFLARRRSVWVPDMPGFGDSDLPEDVVDADSVAPHVCNGISEVLDDRSFDLVGFSFGGLVAGLIAAEAPVNLDRLVFVSVAGFGIIEKSPQLKSLRNVTDPQEREDVLRFNLNALMLSDPAAADDLALLIQQKNIPRDRVRGRSQVMQPILPRLAGRWTCPAYGIWGREDALYRTDIAALQKAASTLGLAGETYLEGAGHWIQYERPQAFNAVLDSYLNATV
ncbi:alpha/beta fold hydrolase [Afifella sp. IM 167]|uniref:alpha/beta fold hydrolase n=1 Tax=Afifella sp. IM 167 TaxID=2033586 RepID=UPI001CCEB8F9|nr:alpha/beta hydrolase [Afifella sp. IM 167]MBZ8134786.1 alpha/beta hydrolase [Afifella sp. IM 167]